jgi:mono/diheme cytochrome c family protein
MNCSNVFLSLLLCTAVPVPPAWSGSGSSWPEGTVPDQEVRAEICENGLHDKDAWPTEPPVATETFSLPAFGLNQLPHKYVDDGVRGARPSPSLLRLMAAVDLPAGTHRFLIRARSASRLSVNGPVVVETKFPPKNGGDGSQADTERLVPLDLGPGYRFAPGGEYEKIAEFQTAGGRHDVRFEIMVGGREGKAPRRVEVGETVVAVALAGSSDWRILTPSGQGIPYQDAAWAAFAESVHRQLAERDAATRAALRQQAGDEWQKRREAADHWLASSPETPVPALPDGFSAGSPVDHFLAAKFSAVKAQNRHESPEAVDYFRQVRPILEARCIDCHRGQKAKGGLQLDSLAAALAGGDSGPALVAGNPADSELIRRIRSHDEDEVMPPKGGRLQPEEIAVLEQWVKEGASWPELPLVRREYSAPADDLTFLRRLTLDTIGLVPTAEEARAFLADPSPDKRTAAIDRLLADPRYADHWIAMWQDLLAENPNILNPTLNNTGPFRWWLHEALADDLPVDRMVTQLVRQGGSAAAGAPAGFGLASQNDAPFAAKGTIISAAFLGVEMKCARCHDSPSGSARQEQLFQLGALLAQTPLDVPKTSSVDPAKLQAGGRKALIEVTLPPGSKVAPEWPFPHFSDPATAGALAVKPDNTRDRLAAFLTAPQNERFAQVIVNRLWQRLMGRGIMEPLDDWEKGNPTHPELLRWLGRELVRHHYQLKPVLRLILTSHAWQRSVDASLRQPDPLYAAPEPRRLAAEQVVDSLFAATGKPMRLDRVCLDLNGRRDIANSLDLGQPRRAWMLASLSNERDRASLTLPRLQAVAAVMEALGWRGARQDPQSVRDTAPNALQPAILANGVMNTWLTRLSQDHGLTTLAVKANSVEQLVEDLFLRLLTRFPLPEEKQRLTEYLQEGFTGRLVANPAPLPVEHRAPKFVTWTNHLQPESDTARQEEEAAARRGDPPTPLLEPFWRQRCEDVIWALLNSPEMLYRP